MSEFYPNLNLHHNWLHTDSDFEGAGVPTTTHFLLPDAAQGQISFGCRRRQQNKCTPAAGVSDTCVTSTSSKPSDLGGKNRRLPPLELNGKMRAAGAENAKCTPQAPEKLKNARRRRQKNREMPAAGARKIDFWVPWAQRKKMDFLKRCLYKKTFRRGDFQKGAYKKNFSAR